MRRNDKTSLTKKKISRQQTIWMRGKSANQSLKAWGGGERLPRPDKFQTHSRGLCCGDWKAMVLAKGSDIVGRPCGAGDLEVMNGSARGVVRAPLVLHCAAGLGQC